MAASYGKTITQKPAGNTFCLFPSDEKTQLGLGLGFLDSLEPPRPPPPPCLEILSSQASLPVNYSVDPVNVGGLTLLKGRVSTQEVFALSNSDLVPGKYEGGLKLWEGSLDLINFLQLEVQNARLSLKGKRVLELGCGHGLPGIFASLEGAAVTHFQDFNAEVLRCLTIPNVYKNLSVGSQNLNANVSEGATGQEVRFFAGDWRDVHQLLYTSHDGKEIEHSSEPDVGVGYDVILMAETVYSTSNLRSLYELIEKCMNRSNGVAYMAAKKHYFGVGGGTRRFISLVEKDGKMVADLVFEVTDGSSNVREVWKLSYK